MENILTQIRAEGEYLTNPTNFIEVYLQKVDSRTLDGTLDDTIYSQENLVSILYDFFIGACAQANGFLTCGILCLALNPNIQAKLQKDIDNVVGYKRKPGFSDKEKMVYLEATTLEILRIGCVAPIAPRKSVRDTEFGIYKIPQGTPVWLNLYSVYMDKEVWGDPEVFRPERFLDSSGKIINTDKTLFFGGGKRNCMAESVARSAMFMLLAGLLQKFNFSVNPAERTPSIDLPDRVLHMSLSPKPFSVIVSPRK